MFSDEAGFSLLSGVVATYAPTGETPILAVPLKYDRLSVMDAISKASDLVTWMQDRPVKGADTQS